MQKKCLVHYIRCGGARAREMMNFINHSRALSVSPAAASLHVAMWGLRFAQFRRLLIKIQSRYAAAAARRKAVICVFVCPLSTMGAISSLATNQWHRRVKTA
jgi:hypothetical protein